MLAGITVISFTHFLQGPSATQFLADLGADVIKVEPVTGAFERSWSGPDAYLHGHSVFHLLGNRNQRSIAVNLRSDGGAEAARRLVARADVLVESYRPGAMDRLGLGPAQIRALNPGIVHASLTGYGGSGPYRDRPGQDVLLQALSGLASLNGPAEAPPIPVGASIVDQHAAAIAAVGILGALFDRARTGDGHRVESDLLSAALDLQIEPLSYHLNGFGQDREPTGVSSPFYKAPYGVFATADGHVCLSLTSTGKLAEIFEDPWFAAIPQSEEFSRRTEINARVAFHISSRTTGNWLARFTELSVWHAPVQTHADVEKDPQIAHNESIMTIDHPTAGTVRLPAHPVRYDGERVPVRMPPPALGEHTRQVLAEVGYDDGAIDGLIAEGAVHAG
ncbi:CoA transferase [Actinomadura madurae]|uniref:CaiB/BaiF CoA transferase family protein n=1 Tax=Actinomadura madurae TaxID=1993 RepID=UPI00399B2589